MYAPHPNPDMSVINNPRRFGFESWLLKNRYAPVKMINTPTTWSLLGFSLSMINPKIKTKKGVKFNRKVTVTAGR